MPLRSALTLTMLLLLHGLLPSVESYSNPCEGYCNDEDSPVCGTNGVTYRNFCVYMNAACRDKTLSLKSTDACEGYVPESKSSPSLFGTVTSTSTSEYSCDNTCTNNRLQVCASDDVTYTNPCQFNAARCKAGGNLWVVDYKSCSQISTLRRTCGLGTLCKSSQKCMMELESDTDKFCANTCANVSCNKGQVCKLLRSQCATEPCPPQPTCVQSTT